MNETINERLIQLIDKHFKGNRALFAKSIGSSSTSFNNYVGGRKVKPGYDILRLILETHEFVSADWLMRGIGQMEKTASASHDYEKEIKQLKIQVELLNKIVELQTEKINTLKAQNSGKPSN